MKFICRLQTCYKLLCLQKWQTNWGILRSEEDASLAAAAASACSFPGIPQSPDTQQQQPPDYNSVPPKTAVHLKFLQKFNFKGRDTLGTLIQTETH